MNCEVFRALSFIKIRFICSTLCTRVSYVMFVIYVVTNGQNMFCIYDIDDSKLYI